MLLRCQCDAGDLNLSKEDCHRQGRGRREGTGGTLVGCSLPGCCRSLSCCREGRGESWFPSLRCSGCPACRPPSGPWPCWGDASRLGTAHGCTAVSWLCGQAGRSTGSKRGPFSSWGQEGDALAAYMSCPLGLCAKPLWDGQEMTQENFKL